MLCSLHGAILFDVRVSVVTVAYGSPAGSNVTYSAYGWAQIDYAKSNAAWTNVLDPSGCGMLFLDVQSMTVNRTTSDLSYELLDMVVSLTAAPNCVAGTVGYLSFGPIETNIMFFVTSACARRPGAAARVERRRRER